MLFLCAAFYSKVAEIIDKTEKRKQQMKRLLNFDIILVTEYIPTKTDTGEEVKEPNHGGGIVLSLITYSKKKKLYFINILI